MLALALITGLSGGCATGQGERIISTLESHRPPSPSDVQNDALKTANEKCSESINSNYDQSIVLAARYHGKSDPVTASELKNKVSVACLGSSGALRYFSQGLIFEYDFVMASNSGDDHGIGQAKSDLTMSINEFNKCKLDVTYGSSCTMFESIMLGALEVTRSNTR